jgi:hypothetical protein
MYLKDASNLKESIFIYKNELQNNENISYKYLAIKFNITNRLSYLYYFVFSKIEQNTIESINSKFLSKDPELLALILMNKNVDLEKLISNLDLILNSEKPSDTINAILNLSDFQTDINIDLPLHQISDKYWKVIGNYIISNNFKYPFNENSGKFIKNITSSKIEKFTEKQKKYLLDLINLNFKTQLNIFDNDNLIKECSLENDLRCLEKYLYES